MCFFVIIIRDSLHWAKQAWFLNQEGFIIPDKKACRMLDFLPCRLSFQEVQGAQASQEGQGSHEVPGKQTENLQSHGAHNTQCWQAKQGAGVATHV